MQTLIQVLILEFDSLGGLYVALQGRVLHLGEIRGDLLLEDVEDLDLEFLVEDEELLAIFVEGDL